MKLSTIAAIASSTLAFAHPWRHCMSDQEAARVADNFKSLISGYSNATADKVLSSSFTDYSDSVIELINSGCPSGPATLGAPTFTSRTDFETGQSTQPNITFNILNTWNNCNSVTIRWRTPNPGFVSPQQQVTGILLAETVRGNGSEPWLIDTVYSEFNSGAWLVDLDLVKTNCK